MALRANRPGMRLPMRVWDGPLRLFHWALVVLVVVAYASAGLSDLRAHRITGDAVVALILFRIAWGIVGSQTARLARLVQSPAAALRQLSRMTTREPDNYVGHNPACAWIVLGLLVLLAAQSAAGLAAGPWAARIGAPAAAVLSSLHRGPLQQALLALILLHLLGIGAYAVLKRQNLLRPMLSGKKMLPAATRAPRMAPTVLAWLVLVLAAIAAWLLARGA